MSSRPYLPMLNNDTSTFDLPPYATIVPIMAAVMLLLAVIASLVVGFLCHVRARRVLQRVEIQNLPNEVAPAHLPVDMQPKIVTCEGVIVLQPDGRTADVALTCPVV